MVQCPTHDIGSNHVRCHAYKLQPSRTSARSQLLASGLPGTGRSPSGLPKQPAASRANRPDGTKQWGICGQATICHASTTPPQRIAMPKSLRWQDTCNRHAGLPFIFQVRPRKCSTWIQLAYRVRGTRPLFLTGAKAAGPERKPKGLLLRSNPSAEILGTCGRARRFPKVGPARRSSISMAKPVRATGAELSARPLVCIAAPKIHQLFIEMKAAREATDWRCVLKAGSQEQCATPGLRLPPVLIEDAGETPSKS